MDSDPRRHDVERKRSHPPSEHGCVRNRPHSLIRSRRVGWLYLHLRTRERLRFSVRTIIADDSRIMRKVLARISREVGNEPVAEASNGPEAVELCREHKPDLV